MFELITFALGCAISWAIAHAYYRRAALEMPPWAKDLVASLPDRQPTQDELLKLFQEHLDSGEVEVNPLLRRVACPDCGESAKEFEEQVFGDDLHTVVAFTCPSCGWSDDADVS